jgi:hypothetical protein
LPEYSDDPPTLAVIYQLHAVDSTPEKASHRQDCGAIRRC